MWNQDLYQKAMHFAASAHKEQKVPGKNYSYTVHFALVAMEIMGAITAGETENPDLAVCCALLHDTLEDTEVTYEELEKIFGDSVARGVRALSKNKNLSKEEQMEDSLKRIKAEPPEVGMVKLADRITNLQTPPFFWKADKKKAYLKEAKRILKELKYTSPFLARRMEEKITDYKQYI